MKFKNKLYIAVVLGVIGFLSGGIVTYLNPSGDTSGEILAVEKRLQAMTDEIGKPLSIARTETPIPKGIIVAPSMDKVSDARPSLDEIYGVSMVIMAPSMDEVSNTVKSLTYENQRIGMAKVMMKINFDMSSEKLPWNAPQWDDRYKYRNKPWLIQEKYQLIGNSLLIALASFAAVCVSSLILIFVLSWFWYFLLERIKELSGSLKG